MDDIEELSEKIKRARAYAKQVFNSRANLAAAFSGAMFVIEHEFEFEPDTIYIYQCIRQLKWVGISRPWGVRPVDIVIEKAKQ